MTLQFGASLTYDTSSVNYDRNMFIIQATEHLWVDGKHIGANEQSKDHNFRFKPVDILINPNLP